MSRFYEVEVDVMIDDERRYAGVEAELAKLGIEVNGIKPNLYGEGRVTFAGTMVLTAGCTEEDKHRLIVATLCGVDRAVASRWRWAEDRPWDEEFEEVT